jgi:hypothetical protein
VLAFKLRARLENLVVRIHYRASYSESVERIERPGAI